MALRVNIPTGKDSSGRNTYSGQQSIGRKRTESGGYELAPVDNNSAAARTNSVIDQQRTENAINQINQQRVDAGRPQLVGTQPFPTRAQQQGTVTSPVLNRAVTQEEIQAMQSNARIEAAKEQARQEDAFSNSRVVLPATTSGTSQPVGTGALSYVGPSLDKRKTVLEPAAKETYGQMFSRWDDQNTQQSLQNKPGIEGVRTQAIGFGIGVGVVALGVVQTIKSPVQSINSATKATFDRIDDPGILLTDAGNVGSMIKNTPGKATGIVAASYATGKVTNVLFGLPNKARFIGKTEAPQTYIAPTFLSGKEIYPKGKPGVVVDNINRQGFAFSASPTRLSSGVSEVKIFTQAEKKAAGLDLSETGGLYAADRISPVFTELVQRQSDAGYRFSLLPRFGAPGSIQKISTKAERLPTSVTSRGFAASNEFIDIQAASKKPGVAFSSPAAEIMRKTEAEVLIPGGSNLLRTQKYGGVKRALGTDFDTYVRIPVKFNTEGQVVKTTKVPIRDYTNVGAKVPGVASISDDIVRGSSSYRSSNPGVFRITPFSSAGYSSGRGSRSSVTPIESSIASSSSSSASSSAAPSSSLFAASGSKGSVAARRSVPEPFSSAGSSIVPSRSVPKYSGVYSVSRVQPFPYSLNRGVSSDTSINKKKYKQPRIKKSDSYLYAPTFTAAFFGVKATAKDKKVIAKAGFYTGLETIRPLV